jgi:hypothetical protein
MTSASWRNHQVGPDGHTDLRTLHAVRYWPADYIPPDPLRILPGETLGQFWERTKDRP